MQRNANGFGALRLFFAGLVITAHSPELLDGSERRELLMRSFGTMTLGELAVNGFFLISGYLITASYMSSPAGYLGRRVRRIYPAFLVCYLVCVFVVAPLGAANLAALPLSEWFRALYRAVFLLAPKIPGVFPGHPYPALNGSMWTISYEFRCYLLTMALGALGLLKKPRVIMGLAAVALVAWVASKLIELPQLPDALGSVTGQPDETARLVAVYLIGACFRLYRTEFKGWIAAAAMAALFPLMFSHALAGPALALLGGYALFWAAFNLKSHAFRTLNAKDDISYGLYLYAFPIGKLLIWYFPAINVWLLAVVTAILALIAGWLSWHLVEKWAMRQAPRRTAPAPSLAS
jgi:peptidoglycan/LPS O-acetylase OafA/YrhL